MESRENLVKDVNVVFNYQSDGTKYYLLTEGTGYPLAEFSSRLLPLSNNGGTAVVVPEKRQKTANITTDT